MGETGSGAVTGELPPVEWVTRDPTTWYDWSNLLVSLGGALLGTLIGHILVPGAGLFGTAFWLQAGILAAIVFATILPFQMLVPRPLNIGLSSIGLVADWGRRWRVYPWTDVRVRDDQLLLYSRRTLFPTRIGLNGNQKERLSRFVATRPIRR
jgi:hypothetical protein